MAEAVVARAAATFAVGSVVERDQAADEPAPQQTVQAVLVEADHPNDDGGTSRLRNLLAIAGVQATQAAQVASSYAIDGRLASSGWHAVWDDWAAVESPQTAHSRTAAHNRDNPLARDRIDAALADDYFMSDGAQADSVDLASLALSDDVFD